MAKSGGVLNAICAKLLKGNLTPQGEAASEGDNSGNGQGHLKVTFKDVSWSHPEQGDLDVNQDDGDKMVENDFDTDKENNNMVAKQSTTEAVADHPNNRDDAQDLLPSLSLLLPPPPQITEGRKNRRKSGKPRNIVEYRDAIEEDYGKDELDEFKINNRDVDFDEIYRNGETEEDVQEEPEGEGAGAMDLSGGLNPDELEPSSEADSMDNKHEECDESRVLDLSVIRDSMNTPLYLNEDSDSNLDDSTSRSKHTLENYTNSDSNMDSSPEETSQSSFNLGLVRKSENSKTKTSSESQSSGPPVEAVAMKNYAQNTVSELLSMYGLGEEANATITQNIQNIPLQKFSTGHILQDQSGLGSLHQKAIKRPMKDAVPKAAKHSDSKGPGENSSSSHTCMQNLSTSTSAESASVQSALASFVQQIPNEGMYAKFVDSVSKLAKLPQGKSSVVSKFATSAEYVKACFNPNLAPKLAAAAAAASGGKTLLPDYSKYIKRFAGYEMCGGNHCRDMSYKEHFHCMDCSFRVFVKKEEMIRHFKWHKKRDESLQHGFMRYSPMDDCGKKFGTCTHNSRQTHYHCLQPGCNKVYISTSDTQMHANYHRKDSAIIQEGFQRFRATEDCGTQGCGFYGQRTTHFHCRRPGCHFTFKNKADMEKHKAYHQKDEILCRDGFKKFMKYEHCRFPNCRYSKASNHIHCIRPGCEYVLHSTGQLYSHKRRHERRDFEHAYRRFKDEQKKKPDATPPTMPPMMAQNLVQTHSPITPSSLPPSISPSLPPAMQRSQPQITPAHTSLNAALSNLSPAHSKMIPHRSPVQPAHQNPQIPMISHAHSTTSPGHMTLPVTKPDTKQEEYIDLDDLSRYDVSSPDISMTPTDLSMNSNASLRKMEIKPDPTPIHISPKVEETPSVGLDLSSNKPQASTLAKLAFKLNSNISLNGSLNLPIPPNEPIDVKPQISTQEAMILPPPPAYVPSGSGYCASPGVAGFVPKSSPPVNDKREKDESWKKYLTRYTANDPCHPRCQFLYKDHYHCNIEGCGMIFRNKDGVREHARYHEQQDRITCLSYRMFDVNTECAVGCQLSKRAAHYHCLWTDCGAIIRTNDPPFTRLEHHKIHEYARAASSRQPRSQAGPLRNDHMKRRRGRPPKYPKTDIPIVPKVKMSEIEIANELRRCVDGSQNTLIAGFKKFAAFEACPDERCIFISKAHFHCVRARCHHATDRADVLNLHAKDFHSYINILDGFEFFDRTVNCRRPHCHNNKANKHFHCVRPRCDYSFVRYSTMAQHDKKHKMMEMGKDITQQSSSPQHQPQLHQQGAMVIQPPQFSMDQGSMLLPNTVVTTNSPSSFQEMRGTAQVTTATPNHPDFDKNVVKTSGTFFPLTSLPLSSAHHPGVSSLPGIASTSGGGPVSISVTPPGVIHASTNAPVLLSPTTIAMSKMSSSAINITPKPSVGFPLDTPPAGLPLTMLLQQRPQQSMPALNWLALKMKMHCGMTQNCGRPFCKLKKKDHYHCFDCNQAFSDPTRLKAHILKHGIKVDGSDMAQPPNAGIPASMMSPTPITIAPIPDNEHEELTNLSEEYEEEEEDEEEIENGDDEPDPSSSLNLDASSFTRLIEAGTMCNVEGSNDNIEPNIAVAPVVSIARDNIAPSTVVDSADGALDLSVVTTTPQPSSSFPSTPQPSFSFPSTPQPSSPFLSTPQPSSSFPSTPQPSSSFLSTPQPSSSYPSTPERSPSFPSSPQPSSSSPSTPTEPHDHTPIKIQCSADFEKDKDLANCSGNITAEYHQNEEGGEEEEEEEEVNDQKEINLVSSVGSPSSPVGRRSSRKRTATRHDDFVDSDVAVAVVKQRRQSSPKPSVPASPKVEEVVPEGYKKFRFSEDCEHERCAYRLSSSHYHCMREDCRYSFTDRMRASQHIQKHERIDNVTGEEFQQFTSNQVCDRSDCEHSKGVSHFHCLKCPFICTDTTKVLAHRKHHLRMDNISSKGFEKFAVSENCQVAGCSHCEKQTHYHCTHLDCQQAVLGPAQMRPHQLKHVNNML